ncbi:hypothetical protein C8J57DRAFT_1529492 [Mycena rebaudengoi]|nr:hypothetical protein C8J57DRAFT_1529492 [Mycena rebaudengoi]
MAFPTTSAALLTIASLVSAASAHDVLMLENGSLNVGAIAAIAVGSFFVLLILAGFRVRRVHRAAAAIKAAMNPSRAMPGSTTVLPVVMNHAIKQGRSRHWRSPLQHPTVLIPGRDCSGQPTTIAKQQTWLDLQCTVPGRDLEKATLSWSPPPLPWARHPLPGSFRHHGTPATTIQTSHARAPVPEAESEPEGTQVQMRPLQHPPTLIPGYRQLHPDKRNLTRQASGVLEDHTSIRGVHGERPDQLAVPYLHPTDNPQLMPAPPSQLPPPPPRLPPSPPPLSPPLFRH